ncbi:ABC transporter substrate-binding protein [Aliiglaciecola sp.]|nr:ABC transporter substrate-binding protein [Aliiglaciecola sp.]
MSPIYIGLDADMSAFAAEGGQAIYQGAMTAINEINHNGGVLDRPLELIVRYHRGNPARGIRNIQAFSQTPDMVAVLGGVHTPVALQELALIHQQELIYLGPWAAGTAIVDNGYEPNYVFRVSIRDAEAAKVLLAHIQEQGISNIALVLERTGWGRSNLASITEQAKQRDITVSQVTWINWRQQQFDDEVALIADSGAKAIVMVANAPEGAVVVKAVLQNKATGALPIVSHWGVAGGNFVQRLGLETLKQINLSVLQTFHFELPGNQKIIKRVLAAYNAANPGYENGSAIPGAVGLAHAYDLVYLLAQAIEQAKSIKAPEIRQELLNIDEYQGLVKTYQQPFKQGQQDALWAKDYIMTRYNELGHLVPFTD